MSVLLFKLLSSSVISFLCSAQLLTRRLDEKPLFRVSVILPPPLAWLRVGSGSAPRTREVRPPRGRNTDVGWTSVLASQRTAHSLRALTSVIDFFPVDSLGTANNHLESTFWMCATGVFCIFAGSAPNPAERYVVHFVGCVTPHSTLVAVALVHAAVLDAPTWLSLEQIQDH